MALFSLLVHMYIEHSGVVQKLLLPFSRFLPPPPLYTNFSLFTEGRFFCNIIYIGVCVEGGWSHLYEDRVGENRFHLLQAFGYTFQEWVSYIYKGIDQSRRVFFPLEAHSLIKKQTIYIFLFLTFSKYLLSLLFPYLSKF